MTIERGNQVEGRYFMHASTQQRNEEFVDEGQHIDPQ
jgi:hypothetical protein